MQILKKLLLFLFILIIASLLFNGNAQETKISEASEIVEIIDNGEQNKMMVILMMILLKKTIIFL